MQLTEFQNCNICLSLQMNYLVTEAEIQVVSPRLVQKHYTNAPRIAMVVQQSKINCSIVFFSEA